MLLKDPKKYEIGPKRQSFNIVKFWGWVLYGMYHSVVVFIIFMYMPRYNYFDNGMPIDIWHSGQMMMACLVVLCNIVIINDYSKQTLEGILLVLLMFTLYILFTGGLA